MPRRQQYIKLDYSAIDQTLKLFPDAAFKVWVILQRYADRDTRQCDPSQELIARKTGIEIRSVRRALRWLEDSGLATKERLPRIEDGQTLPGWRCLYTLHDELLYKPMLLQANVNHAEYLRTKTSCLIADKNVP